MLKLSLLNNLGSITGGMTSTPALGTLISVSGTDEVASAYAATYPIALLAVVLVSQFLLVLLFGFSLILELVVLVYLLLLQISLIHLLRLWD